MTKKTEKFLPSVPYTKLPTSGQDTLPLVFKSQEIKAAIKREQTKARFQFAEREQARNKVSTFLEINKHCNQQINKAYNNGSNNSINKQSNQH